MKLTEKGRVIGKAKLNMANSTTPKDVRKIVRIPGCSNSRRAAFRLILPKFFLFVEQSSSLKLIMNLLLENIQKYRR